MRRHLVLGVLIAIAAVIAYHFAYRAPAEPPPGELASRAGSASTASSATSVHALPMRVPAHVTKLTTDERHEIANRIAAAQSVHHSAPPAPKLPDPTETD